MKANGVDIIGLADEYLVITSSAWQNNHNVPNGGVGLMMNNKLKKCITNINVVSLRILRVDFTGNPADTLLIHFAPMEGNNEAAEN